MARWIAKCSPGLIAALSLAALFALDLDGGDAERAQEALQYRGVLRAADGQPIMGAHVIGVELWDAAHAGERLCSVSPQSIAVEHGQFSLALSGDCAYAFGRGRSAWADLVVDGERLSPRAQLLSPAPRKEERRDGAVAPAASDVTNPVTQPGSTEPAAAPSGEGDEPVLTGAAFRI